LNPALASFLTPLALSPPPIAGEDDAAEHAPFILAVAELLRPPVALELGNPRLARWFAAAGLPTHVVPQGVAGAAPAALVVVHAGAASRWREALSAPLAGDAVALVLGGEVSGELPSFRFDHGGGLVALCPAAVPGPLRPLLEAGPVDAREIRAVFSALGARCAPGGRGAARAAELERSLEEQERRAVALQATLAMFEGSWVWKAGRRYWALRDRVLEPGTRRRAWFDAATARAKESLVVAKRRAAGVRAGREHGYARWIAKNTPSGRELAALRARAAALPARPLVSVLTPVHDVPERSLRRCIESVQAQVYDRWELCLVDDASTQPHVWRVLREYAERDPRIRAERSERSVGIVAASARCLELATGELVALLDREDELAPEALFEIARAIGEDPRADVLYSDEDELDERGRRVHAFFKPDWSPDLLLSFNYAGHLAVLRRSLAVEVGGFRAEVGGSQDHDLLLRATERARSVLHVPKVLYHSRKVTGRPAAVPDAVPPALEGSRRAVEDALARRGIAGTATMPRPGIVRVQRHVAQPPLVSIVVPTRDRADLLRALVGSLEARTAYRQWELVVVDNGTSEPESVAYLAELGRRHRVLRDDSPFNWSAINNRGVRAVAGTVLLFLNNDIEVVDPEWLDALVEHAVRPEVGAVGAKLLFPGGAIQHAGVVLGIGGVGGHAFKHLPGDTAGYFGQAAAIRDVSAVTGACLMVRRDAFDEVGGFDERLRVAFNDIDFCLKLRARGYLNVYTPYSTLVHHESATRKALHPPADEALMMERWRDTLASDPYYSPHLTREREDYAIRR
jgi:GT2 family glycosyltransferase